MKRRFVIVTVLMLGLLSAQGFVRPETTRVYLQGPDSERMAVMWREGMITLAEVLHDDEWTKMPYWPQTAHAVRLTFGEGVHETIPDFHTTKWEQSADGSALWTLVIPRGALEYRLSAAVPFDRKPTVFGRLEVVNRGESEFTDVFRLRMRTGLEMHLVHSAPDLYTSYNAWKPWERWQTQEPSWCGHSERPYARSGAAFLQHGPEDGGAWDMTGGFRYEFTLRPGERRTVEFVFGIGRMVPTGYAAAAERTKADWSRLLEPVRERPLLDLRLVAQILQCMACSTDGTFLPRQGGLQRWVWPGESLLVVKALLGCGYPEYARKTVETLLHFAKADGSIGPFGNGWASDTSYSLSALAEYLIATGDRATWERYRETAAKAADWIESKRLREDAADGDVKGLFPSMKSTDSVKVFQNWGHTDLRNQLALALVAEAAAKFGDTELAERSRARSESYRQAIAGYMDRWRRAGASSETFEIPFAPDGRHQRELLDAKFFMLHPGEFAAAGYLDAEDLRRVHAWLLKTGWASPVGLYQRHPSPRPELGERIWYTTWSEYNWAMAWKRIGREDLAAQALKALLDYSVTAEGLVGERIHEQDPWYYPWCPNASGAARILLMR